VDEGDLLAAKAAAAAGDSGRRLGARGRRLGRPRKDDPPTLNQQQSRQYKRSLKEYRHLKLELKTWTDSFQVRVTPIAPATLVVGMNIPHISIGVYDMLRWKRRGLRPRSTRQYSCL
jgi:hypothetical protein